MKALFVIILVLVSADIFKNERIFLEQEETTDVFYVADGPIITSSEADEYYQNTENDTPKDEETDTNGLTLEELEDNAIEDAYEDIDEDLRVEILEYKQKALKGTLSTSSPTA